MRSFSRRLSDLVNYVESVKFRGLDAPRRYWEMSSFDESKCAAGNCFHKWRNCKSR